MAANKVEKPEVIMKQNNDASSAFSRSWQIFFIFRIAINLFGQRAYIHPDEFFQGKHGYALLYSERKKKTIKYIFFKQIIKI